MARLYFDHNVARAIGQLLGRSGHDVTATGDVSHERLPDDAQLLFAVQSSRVFVTHNRADFKMLHDAWLTWPAAFGMALPPHSGILILDQSPPETLARELGNFLDATPPAQFLNGIFWWRRRLGWYQPSAGVNWGPFQSVSESERE